jgi:hypothetical protein
VTYQITRGASVWQGNDVVTLANSATGATIMALPSGRWAAIVGRDGKTMATFEPPIGYIYPLSVGKQWETRHKVKYANGTVNDMLYACKVEAREKVTVPAGTFDTLRIVCETPFSRDVSWSIVDLGMHAKQDFRRFEGHPQGAGTQLSQLMAVTRR